MSCGLQRSSISLCLIAGDDNGFGCDSVPESDFSCKLEGCKVQPISTCFSGDCFQELEVAFDISNSEVSTVGATFKVTRSGSCVTFTPTDFPTTFPTKSPTIAPTKFPTLAPTSPVTSGPTGCGQTLDFCGGGAEYAGPRCCVEGSVCEFVDSELSVCVEANPHPTHEEKIQKESSGIYVFTSISIMTLFLGTIAYLLLRRSVNSREKTEVPQVGEDGAEEPPLSNIEHYASNDNVLTAPNGKKTKSRPPTKIESTRSKLVEDGDGESV